MPVSKSDENANTLMSLEPPAAPSQRDLEYWQRPWRPSSDDDDAVRPRRRLDARKKKPLPLKMRKPLPRKVDENVTTTLMSLEPPPAASPRYLEYWQRPWRPSSDDDDAVRPRRRLAARKKKRPPPPLKKKKKPLPPKTKVYIEKKKQLSATKQQQPPKTTKNVERRSPWLPELTEERSMKWGLSRDAVRNVVKRELQRSIEQYKAPTSAKEVDALLRTMAERREDLVVILDNRLFVHETFLQSGDETERRNKCRHLKIVHAALTRTPKGLPNAAYLYSRFPTKEKCGVPELVVAKPEGYGQCGILIPSVTFAEPKVDENRTTRYRNFVSKVEASWHERTPKAIWRGKSVDDETNPLHCTVCRTMARARLEVLALSRADPKRFQCHCAVGTNCDFNDSPSRCGPNRRLSYFNNIEGHVGSTLRTALKFASTMREIANEPSSKHTKEPMNRKLLSKYKYIMGVPLDWNLNTFWSLGGVVFLWNSPLVEWYFPALQHDVTHLAVDLYTASQKVDHLEQRPDDAARLVRNALKLHNILLCPDCTLTYFALVIYGLRKYFRLYDVLDDFTSRSAFLRDSLGSWSSHLVEVKFGTTLTMVDIYQDESYNVLKKMIASTESSDSLMFHRSVAGDHLAPTTNWRLHDWRPDLDLPSL